MKRHDQDLAGIFISAGYEDGRALWTAVVASAVLASLDDYPRGRGYRFNARDVREALATATDYGCREDYLHGLRQGIILARERAARRDQR